MIFRPVKSTHVIGLLIIIGLIGVFIYHFGPLDSIPRLRASAISPDRSLTVKVYKQRLALYPNLRVGVLVKIYDEEGRKIYDKIIFEDGWWNEDIGEMYTRIMFNDSEILIGPKFSPDEYYIIKKDDLKMQ
jgi:hypothetical protein